MSESNIYNLSLSEMCKVGDIKRANYYKWLHHEKGDHDLENEELLEIIKQYEEECDHTLGYRMMTDKINREKNKNYNDKRIYKIMRISGIQSRIRRRPRSCTVRKNNNTAENVLGRDFNAKKPNEKWVADVTEFKYGPKNEHKLYLSAFFDLYDRTIVGYALSDSNNNMLVYDSFKMAVENNPGATPLVHSDGGYQYTNPAFVNQLKLLGMTQSMSRVHCCIDNGPMEGFWGILKCEAYKDKHFDTREELVKAIEKWIDYYTNKRYQRRFGVRTPAEVRSEALASDEPAYYPIPENRRIEKYKMEHYKYNTDSMTAQL